MATPESAAATPTAPTAPTLPKVPIPPRGVDYRGKLVLAPMVRSGELPMRLASLHYGADLVWGPETVDRSLIGATRRINPRNGMIEYTRAPTHQHSPAHQHPHAESVLYRVDPARERGKLIFQLGTADAALALQAARFVAGDVAGIDVNAGCPKPFSVHCGMGAALLRAPAKLAEILRALVREVAPAFGIGISVKIRLLETPAETEALVRRLVATGITGLTVHCRTTDMRPRERAIRAQLRMVAAVCREAGVACLMNGDVEGRAQAEALVAEFGVDGAMIATAAEKNPSCFRAEGKVGWEAVVENYLGFAIEAENKLANTKFSLTQLVPGKAAVYKELHNSRGYVDLAVALGYTGLVEKAREADRLLWLGEFEVKRDKKKKGTQQVQVTHHTMPGDQQASKKRKRKGDEANGESAKRATEVLEPTAAPATAASIAV
ncbi:FMN-linked oxidoreductase [Trichocladium antarcticum]|uniref:FMN-linked oxidoreductase n=1 Tax=Trichocladium antarcticum TaxID=1450529 RepID=A0AAN6UP72_9PEZI|nr:FMN-linked oxidoreductase [Trichocladium antarcticum]